MIENIVSRNGDILPAREAGIGIDNLELTHGFGVHETLRCVNRIISFREDHVARLCASAHCIGLEHSFREEDIARWFQVFAERIKQPVFMLKVRLVGASRKEEAQLFIYAVDLPPIGEEAYRTGISLIAREGERIYPSAKTFCMLQSYILYREAKARHAHDCLLINRRGEVTEGTRTNFFAVKEGAIYSAPSKDILAGITRKQVLAIATNIGIPIHEEPIRADMLPTYDGFFVTSTSINMLPVTRIDELIKPIPRTIEHLREAYGEHVRTL